MSILITGTEMPTIEQGVRTINIYADGVVTNYAEETIGKAVSTSTEMDRQPSRRCHFCGETRSVKYTKTVFDPVVSRKPVEVYVCSRCAAFYGARYIGTAMKEEN